MMAKCDSLLWWSAFFYGMGFGVLTLAAIAWVLVKVSGKGNDK